MRSRFKGLKRAREGECNGIGRKTSRRRKRDESRETLVRLPIAIGNKIHQWQNDELCKLY